MVFIKSKMSWNVLISPDKLDPNGLKLRKAITLRLLEEFSARKATEQHGYFVAVTDLEKLGEGKVRELTGDVLFPVNFSCITVKPFRGEILDAVVDKVLKQGIFLKSGPMQEIFIPVQTMADYKYVAGENPIFMNDKNSKIEKEYVIRFKVLGVQWKETERTFRILGTLASDFLGPI